MSLTAISSLSDNALSALFGVNTAATANTFAQQSALSADAALRTPPATTAASADPQTAVTKDLAALLKALSSGDLATAKDDLTTLKKDLKTSESGTQSGAPSVSTTANPSASASSSPLDKLVQKLSDALNSGSTDTALGDVASYLVSSGSGTGNLLSTSA